MEKTAVMLLSSQFNVCARFTCFNTSLIRADSDCISALTEFNCFSANFAFRRDPSSISALTEFRNFSRFYLVASPCISALTEFRSYATPTNYFPVISPSTLHVYIDQESDGMYFIDDTSEHATKLSHADFIAGDWLPTLNAKNAPEVKLIIERAHTVDARKSPAQRFKAEEWKAFKNKCITVGNARGINISLHGWPERTTPSARTFLYGNCEKATKDSGIHDIKAMRAYHHARLESINLMNLMEPRYSVPQAIRDAVKDHKELMNFHLLRLKNHKYPQDHPWMQQAEEALPRIATKLTAEQLELLGMSFHKRTGQLNKTFNKSRVLTFWAATHDLDGRVLRDDAGNPVGSRFLKEIMQSSPFRERHCGIHRANIMRDFRKNFIERRLGKIDKDKIYTEENHDDFIKARNAFNSEWLKIAKVFRDFEVF